MSKVAAVASQGGVSLEKLMAILTVTEDQTQQSADTINKSVVLKSILIMRKSRDR